jgi:hypothetical protein
VRLEFQFKDGSQSPSWFSYQKISQPGQPVSFTCARLARKFLQNVSLPIMILHFIDQIENTIIRDKAKVHLPRLNTLMLKWYYVGVDAWDFVGIVVNSKTTLCPTFEFSYVEPAYHHKCNQLDRNVELGHKEYLNMSWLMCDLRSTNMQHNPISKRIVWQASEFFEDNLRYADVIWLVFHVLQLLLIGSTRTMRLVLH